MGALVGSFHCSKYKSFHREKLFKSHRKVSYVTRTVVNTDFDPECSGEMDRVPFTWGKCYKSPDQLWRREEKRHSNRGGETLTSAMLVDSERLHSKGGHQHMPLPGPVPSVGPSPHTAGGKHTYASLRK